MNRANAFFLIFTLAASPLVLAEAVPIVQDLPGNSIRALSGPRQEPRTLYGIASWYSERDPHINRHTANGEVFDDSRLTCASWDYPFGTVLRVENLGNRKSVVCRVNDRGPSRRLDRLVDLTQSSFRRIADLKLGLIRVKVTPVGKASSRR